MGELIKKNPIHEIQVKYKELESGIKVWLSKQSLPVEAAVVTATGSLQGAAIGGLMASFAPDLSTLTVPESAPSSAAAAADPKMASLKQAQALTAGGPLIQARNFAVMTGVNAGITCVLKRLRGGKEDVKSSMAAAFGSGAVFTLVSNSGAGMSPPNLAANAVSSGLLFALMQGGIYKVSEKFSKSPTSTPKPRQTKPEDVLFTKTRSMLNTLGFPNYEKNFKRGLLNDITLPLLTDSALRDVEIPPGPRLLIIDHIKRDPELNTGKAAGRT